MHEPLLIKGFISCWTLLRTYFISVFLQHVEPLFALVWLPSVFAGQAAAVVPVGEKTVFRKKIEIRDKLEAETKKKNWLP